MTLTVAEFARTRFDPHEWSELSTSSVLESRAGYWPASAEPMWGAVPHPGEPGATAFSIVSDGYVNGHVSEEAHATLSALCWHALRTEPFLGAVFEALNGRPGTRRTWADLTKAQDSSRWLAVLAYRAEQLQARCRALLSVAYTQESGIVQLHPLRRGLTAGLFPDVRWWGVPRQGWDPRRTPAQLVAAPVPALDSASVAKTAGWAGPGSAHVFAFRFPSVTAPFLVPADPDPPPVGSSLPAVFVACGDYHR